MKLRLPINLRAAISTALFSSSAFCFYATASEAMKQVVSGWPGGKDVSLQETEDTVLINTNADELSGLETLNVGADANYTLNITGWSEKAGETREGYGVLGDGMTVINVKGGDEEISSTSLNLHGFLNLRELNIGGNAVVTLAPGMFMNGDMTHDIAGIEGMETSAGVKIGVINLGNGTLILNNGSGYLYDNSGYANGAVSPSPAEGYILNVTHDNAYVQVGSNARTKWKLINGQTSDGVYHDLRIGGLAREFDVAEITGIKNLTLEGGYLIFHKVEDAVHGNLTVGHAASVVVGGNNMMASGSGELRVSGLFDIGTTSQRLTGRNSIRMNNGHILGVASADDLTDGLQFIADGTSDNQIELIYSGMANRISSDVHVEGQVRLSTISSYAGGDVHDMLTISGYLSGAGNIGMSGSGMVAISADNKDFTGTVEVNEGSSLSLNHIHSLSSAEKLTIADSSYLYLNTDGLFPVELKHLHLGNGATLAIQNLPSSLTVSSAQAAISAERITLDTEASSVNIIFNDELRTMRVYNVFFASEEAVAISGLSEINFYMNNALGERMPFEDGHYVIGTQHVDNGYLYYVETRFGNIWRGGAENSWTADAAVWNNNEKYDATSYDYALFFNQQGVEEAQVKLDEQVSVKGIYIQNVGSDATANDSTRYVFVGSGREGEPDIAGGTELHMRDTAVGSGAGTLGNGSQLELRNVKGGTEDNPMGWMSVSVGELQLTDKSVVYYNGNDMVQVGAAGDARLSVDATSQLISSKGAVMTGYNGGVAAVSGVKMTGDAILGGNSAGNTGISYLENAALNGFNVEAIELRGSGSITNGGIGADTGLSTDYNGLTSVAAGASWTLAGRVDFNDTLSNSGTVIIADGALLDFSDLQPQAVSGNSYTYTLISGGKVEGWDKLELSDFQFGDVNLGEVGHLVVMDSSVTGQITLTTTEVKLISWDTGWNQQKSPVLGKTFMGQNWSDGLSGNLNLADGAFNFAGNGSFEYDQIVASAPAGNTVVVIQRDNDSGSEGLFLAGGCDWDWAEGSSLTGNTWIYDEGSDYNTKIGGYKVPVGATLFASTLIGDSHLQIVGESHLTDVEVYGGSWGIRQTGDAFLSINAGGYINIYGGSRAQELDGDVHMRLNSGIINTYFEGNTYSTPQGTNGQFVYGSSSAALSAMGQVYGLAADKVAHWGGIYATGSTWESGGAGEATKVLGNADIYLGSAFDFSSNLAVIDGGAAHVDGLSTLHFTDGVKYTNLNKETVYAWIAAVNGYLYWDQYSASDVQGTQPFVGKFTSVEVRGFDRIELADGAWVTLQSSRFNTDTDVTVSGGGVIELLRPEVFQDNYYGIWQAPFDEKNSEQGRSIFIPRRNITLTDGARLKVATDYITAWNADSGFTSLIAEDNWVAASKSWSTHYDHARNGRSDITVTEGATLDISDWQRDSAGGNMLVDVFISGHGTDGLGALYKGVSEYDRDTAAFFQFPYIEVTGNTSFGIAAGASPIYMYGADNVYDNVDLNGDGDYTDNGEHDENNLYLGDYNQSTLKLHNHTLTITGGGTFVLVNTLIPEDVGGTIYVEEGTLRAVNTPDHRLQEFNRYGLTNANEARHVTIAKTTDIVLSEVGLLHTDLNNGSDNLSEPLGSGLQSLKFASLSGQGETNLEDFGLNGIELIVNRDQFYTEYLDESQKYWNENGYAYAVYSGTILGDSDSSVSKSGDGVQYFSGSESTYGSFMTAGRLGGTYVSGGILYAIGTSSFGKEAADSFKDGMTRVDVGVFGSGDVYWTSYKDAQGDMHEGRVYLSDGVRITNPGSYYLNPQLPADMQPDEKNIIIGVEAAPTGTALNEQVDGKYTFLIDQNDDKVSTNVDGKAEHTGYITLDGVDYVRIDTHNLSKLNGVSGIYLDGSSYNSGDVIDRNKMLLLTAEDWEKVKSGEIAATVTGLGSAGYNEATWSGLLHDENMNGVPVSANLVKEGAGTLVLDQLTSYSGTTSLNGGTLSLKGWVDPNSIAQENKFSMVEGSSLKLSFDGTYTDGGMDVEQYASTGKVVMTGEVNEDTELSENMVLVGRGDVRWTAERAWVPSWENEQREDFTDGETAALISDVGAGVDFTISGLLSGEGNLLHSGNGTLTLTNANTYSGGTVVTRSHVYVEHDTALGDTASGQESARVVTWKNSHLHFADGVHTTIASPTTNSIEGSVYIGEQGMDAPQETQLTMTGNGYWAEQTYVENHNSVLLFSGESASNTGGGDILGNGAGTVTGKGTIAVSDFDTEAADLTHLTTESFAEMNNYSGSVVVEGERATLHIGKTTSDETGYGTSAYVVSSGVSESVGQVTVSGQGAHFDAAGADIIVSSGSSMNLSSTAYSSYDRLSEQLVEGLDNAATVTAEIITIENGSELNVSFAATDWQYNLAELQAAASLSQEDVLDGYGLTRAETPQQALDGAKGYDYYYDKSAALNTTAAGAANVSSLTVKGGATYSPSAANTTLCGGQLTLDVSNGEKINLDLKLDRELKSDVRQQIVLFSGVDSINYIGFGETDTHALTLDGSNNVYFTMASNYFESHYIDPASTFLVWDASAGVVYLDYVVPEPATATLSLLALAALAARRRRKK